MTTSPPDFTCQLTQSPMHFPHSWEPPVGSGQMEQLHAASVLRPEPQAWTHEDNAIALALPPQSVACVTIVLP